MSDFVPSSAEAIVVEAQRILLRYMATDSGITPAQCLGELIEVLDSPQAVEIFENVEARQAGGYRADQHGQTAH